MNVVNNTQLLVIDGNFSNWSKWSVCSKKCGYSFKSSQRICNKPVPINGGKQCVGLAYITSICPTNRCHSKICF